MYKFLDIQSRKEAADDYQPKGDYLTPSQYEGKYGKVIDDRFKGYMPIGDYLFNDADKFKQSKIWPSIQTELSNYQPKNDYTLNTDFKAYKEKVGSTYATNADLNSYKDTVGKTYAPLTSLSNYQPKDDYTLNSDFNSYKDTVGKTYAPLTSLSNYQPKDDYTLNSDFNSYKDTVGKTYATNADLNTYKEIVGSTYAPLSLLSNYQPKDDYLTPSMYEDKYGKVIEDKLKGNLPVGNYLLDDPEKFQESKVGNYIGEALGTFAEGVDHNFKNMSDNYVTPSQMNEALSNIYSNYVSNQDFSDYKEGASSVYADKNVVDAINNDLGSYKQDTQGKIDNINSKINAIYLGYKNPEVFQDEKIKQLFSPSSHLRTRNYMFY